MRALGVAREGCFEETDLFATVSIVNSYGSDVSDPLRAFSSLPVLPHCGLLAQLPASPCLAHHNCCGCLLHAMEPLQEVLWGKGIAAPQPCSEMLPKILAMAEMVSEEETGPHPPRAWVPYPVVVWPERGWRD